MNPLQFNVRDFGAKADGVTDDTGAIQKALDAAGKVQGVVAFGPGVYCCGELRLPSHVMLVGAATWSYRDFGGSILRLSDPKARCLLYVGGAAGVRLDGLSVDGAQLGKNVHGLLTCKDDQPRQEHNLIIQRCRIGGFTGDGLRLDDVWCFQVFDSMLCFNRGCGIRVCGWDAELSGCQLSGNGLAGYGALEHSASVTMTGNRIEWNGKESAGGGNVVLHDAMHYNLCNNYLDRAFGPAIVLTPATPGGVGAINIAITSNMIHRSGNPLGRELDEHESCHVRCKRVRGLSFTGNVLSAGRGDGDTQGWSPQYAMVLEDLDNCVIQGNAMHNAALGELIRDMGGHGENVVIQSNPGSIFVNDGREIWNAV